MVDDLIPRSIRGHVLQPEALYEATGAEGRNRPAIAVEATRGAGERERRQRLTERRASLPEETLATLKRRAEEALVNDGVARTPLGGDMWVKLKRDALLLEAWHEDGHPTSEATTSEATPTSRASNGREALNRRAGEIRRAGQEATRHG